MCKCAACNYGRKVRANLDKIEDNSVKEFFYNMYVDVMHLEEDLAWTKGKNIELMKIESID